MTLLTKLVKSKNKSFTIPSNNLEVVIVEFLLQLMLQAFGHDLCAFVYDQCRMREHLLRCLQQIKMEPFPYISMQRTGTPRVQSVNVYCYCRCPDSGNAMVCCDGKSCGEWFHIEYIDAAVKKGAKWYCKKM